MGFIKTSMIGFMILSIISVGMYGFLGELNDNYNSSLTYEDQTSYNSEVEELSIEMKKKLNIDDISTGDTSSLTTNWRILSNVFGVILSVPQLFVASINASMSVFGLKETWIAGMLTAVIGVIFAFVFIKYVLGKDLWRWT